MALQTSSSLKVLSEQYQRGKVPIPFDFKNATNQIINEKHYNNSRQLHYIHYYPGRIYPHIPLFILSLDEFSYLEGRLLDPFAGTGTILLESLINPINKRDALGIEINPLARLIAKVKTTRLDFDQTDIAFSKLKRSFQFDDEKGCTIPDYDNIDIWFSKEGIKELAKLKENIQKLDASPDIKDFFWVCFSGVVRRASRADPFVPPPVVLKPDKYANNPSKYRKAINCLKFVENPMIWDCFEMLVNKNREKLYKMTNFWEISNGHVNAEIIWNDARNINIGHAEECGRIASTYSQKMSSKSIDIIFTSPPYLTAQKYIRTSKLQLIWLGYSPKEILELEKQSIGTERVPSSEEISQLNIKPIDELIDQTCQISKQRGIEVYSYFKDMLKTFEETHRVLKKDGVAIFVVGNNHVLGQKIETNKLLTQIARVSGFRDYVILRDEIKTRSMMTKRNGTGGLIKNEYVIILTKEV